MNTKILCALVAMFAAVGISTVSASVTDETSGNLNGVSAVAAPVFNQVVVTNVTNTKATATIGKGYAQGWAWTLTLQVPCAETNLSMKFSNWTGASVLTGSFAADGNTQFSMDNVTFVAAGNAYDNTITLVPGTCDSEVGYTATVYVQAQVPATAYAGNYASNFGIKTN